VQKITKAILPVAGLGTRFLPATKAQPKEMLPIVDKPVIQLLVEEAIASGIKEIIFVTGKNKRALEDHFDYAPELEAALLAKGKKDEVAKVRAISDAAKFSYVRQREPRGDGDALLSASHLIGDEPVAVLFGDDLVVSKTPCLAQMIGAYEKSGSSIVAVEPVPWADVHRYGIVSGKKVEKSLVKIDKLVEKPRREDAPSNLGIVGKYIVTPDVFRQLHNVKQKGEIRLADAFIRHLAEGGSAYGYQFEGTRYDCGSKIGFLKATVALGLLHEETGSEFKKYLKGLMKRVS
jgi:UTP--glucose-1-phosphate uridylyltransferase